MRQEVQRWRRRRVNPKEDNLRKAWSPVVANDIFSHLGTLAMVQPPNYYAISFVDQIPHIMTRCFKKDKAV